MSKTDKTQPWWYGRPWEAWHHIRCVNYLPHGRHLGARNSITRDRPCDLPAEPPRRKLTDQRWPKRGQGCYWWPDAPNYYSRAGARFWPRPPSVQGQANQMERGIRAAWRMARRELLQVVPCRECGPGRNCYCDLDDIELPDPRHRHFALWDRW